MKPLVCVFAHPDDEAMGPGGTIAKFAKEREVFLVCATSGNSLKEPNSGELARVREKELQDSARILGIKKVDFLGFNDGELNNNLYHQLANRITERVEDYQPDTLLTFETTGVTGHLDHIAVALATSFVFQKLDYIKKLLYYCQSKEQAESLAKAYFIFVPKGYSASEVDETIDISSVLEQKKQAIAVHRSQVEDVERNLNLLDKLAENQELFLKLEKS